MVSKKTILEVDFIGGEGTLTNLEEKALSEYLQRKKLKTKSKLLKPENKRDYKTA